MSATETIVFPDSVAVCGIYLAAALVAGGDSDTHVGGRVQGSGNFVVLELVDAETKDIVIQRSTIRVDCWVDDGPLSKQNAQDLGQLCRGLLGAMRGTVQAGQTIYRVTDGSPGLKDAPDPVTGKRVFSFHFVISMRGGATLDESTVVSVPDWLRSGVESVVAGTNVTVDNTDPANPVVSSTGGSGDIADAVALVPATNARNVIAPTDHTVNAFTIHSPSDEGNNVYAFKVITDEPADSGSDVFLFYSTDNGGDLLRLGASGDFEIRQVDVHAQFTVRRSIGGGYSATPGVVFVVPMRISQSLAGEKVDINAVGIVASNDLTNSQTKVASDTLQLTLPVLPADVDLADSAVAFGLDDTPGAPTLKLLAKDADGALYSATIPMTAV